LSVLDASALLAYLLDEPGADTVERVLSEDPVIGAPNLAEVLTKLSDVGEDPETAADRIAVLGVTVVPFDEALAVESARLRSRTARAGLSLGDRACLALGRVLQLPVLTADAAWRGLIRDVDVRVIR
jgi:ribonuclease VapC